MMLVKILEVSYLYNIREVNSCTGRSFNDHRGCNAVCTKPMLPSSFFFVFLHCRILFATSLQISNYGTCLHFKSSFRVEFLAVLNCICRGNCSFQHADPGLRKAVSLRKQGIKQKVGDKCPCSFHLLMVNCNPIERHGKFGMRLRRTTQYECCQLKDPRTTDMQTHKTIYMIWNPTWYLLCTICAAKKVKLFSNCKHTVDWSTWSAGSLLHLSLFTNEGIKSSFCGLNFGSPDPA